MDRFLDYLKSRDENDLEKEKLHHEETMETIKSLTKLADTSVTPWNLKVIKYDAVSDQVQIK